MVILQVFVRVAAEHVATFIEATTENARASALEPGVLRFTFAGQNEDPTQFLLTEIYVDETAIEAHRKSSHYLKWRESAESMMAEPRKRIVYRPIFPSDPAAW